MAIINGIAAGSDQNVGLLRMGARRYRAYLGETLVYGERDLDLPPGAGKILTNAANPIAVSEGFQTSFTVWLDRRPLSSVRLDVTLAEHPRDPITLVTSARLRFTRGNWNTPQTVTIEANDVPDVTDLYTSLTITGPEDRILNSVTRQIRIRNDDLLVPRLELDKTSLEFGPNGDTNSFRARLTLNPSADVTVAFSELANASTNPTSLTFTPADANAWQTITVISGEDTGMETLTLTPSGGGVDGVAKTIDISVVDKAQVSISPDSLTLLEGETKEIQVRVVNAPEDYVVIVRVDEASPLIYAGPQLLTFADARDQAVRVTALDGVLSGDQDGTAQVRFILSGAGDNFTKVLPVAVVNTDSSPLISATPTYLPMDAESMAAVAVKLTTRPYADVTVSATLPTRAGTLSASELTFTRDNWNTAQELTVTAVALAVGANDVLAELKLEGSGGGVADTATVSILVASAAAGQNSLLLFDTIVTLVVGGTTQVEVQLDTPPYLSFSLGQPVGGTVNVALASDDAAKISVSPATMTFDEDDWNVPKLITLSNVGGADGDSATITLTPSGGNSDGVAKQIVANAAGTTALPFIRYKTSRPLMVPGGPYVRGQYVLSSAPTAPVVMRFRVATAADFGAAEYDNPVILENAPVTLTFDRDNYNDGLTLSTRAPADARQRQVTLWYEVLEGALRRHGFLAEGKGLIALDIAVQGVRDVLPRFLATGISMSANESITIGVELTERPTNPVTVRVTEQSPLLNVLGGASLQFTPQNWNVAQSITLMGLTPPSRSVRSQAARTFNIYAYASGPDASPDPAVLRVEVLPSSAAGAPLDLSVSYGDISFGQDDTGTEFRETWFSWTGTVETGTTDGYILDITGPSGTGGYGGLDSDGTLHLYYQTTTRGDLLLAGFPYTATLTRYRNNAKQASETISFTPPHSSGLSQGSVSSSSGPNTPTSFSVRYGSRSTVNGVPFIESIFSWGNPTSVPADRASYVFQYSGPYSTGGTLGRPSAGTQRTSFRDDLYAGESYTASVYVDGLSSDAALLTFTTPS